MAEKLASSLNGDAGTALHESLSDRELQVLRMLGSGKTVKEIGHELSLSEKTISTYRARILEKMNLRTTADLIRYAIHSELVE
jgi:DNA-binding NarL/FixJ family response regulator